MARQVHNDVLDALLDKIATSTRLDVCSGGSAPADRAAAITASLASTSVATADFTITDGSSGRKTTLGQQSDISIATSGDATHICLSDAASLLFVTTCTQQTLTAGGTVTVPSFDIQVDDPTELT